LFAPGAWRCAAIGGFTLKITVPSSGFAHSPERVFHPMRIAHGCHSQPALQARAGPAYMKAIGRATISSSNVPDRIGGPSSSQAADRHQQSPPDLLPRRALFLRRT